MSESEAREKEINGRRLLDVCQIYGGQKAPPRESNLREQISIRRAGKAAECRVKKRKTRERKRERKRNRGKSPMPYRGALTGIHFKFRPGTPQSSWKTSARRRRKKRERASERAGRTPCKQNKVSVSGDYGAESGSAVWYGAVRCGVAKIAGYRKAGPKEI